MKITNAKMMVSTDGNGEVTLARIVGKANDGTYKHGEVSNDLTPAEKAAIKNVVKKIITKLETQA